MELSEITHPTFRSLTSSDGIESEVEEEEVDQLDSDSEEDVQPSASVAGPAAPPTKTRPKITIERVPGRILPLAGEESFMSKEAVFLLAVATEEFIKRLLEAGHRSAHGGRRSMINYRDVASSATQYQEFMFLEDTIPQPISLAEALQRRNAKEKEILEEPVAVPTRLLPSTSNAPSIAASDSPSATPDFVPPSGTRLRGKGKQTAQPHANGTANGESASAASEAEPKRTRERRSRKRAAEDPAASAPKESLPTHSHRTRRRTSKASQGLLEFVDTPPPPTNGHSATNGRSASHRGRTSEEYSEMAPPAAHAPDQDVETYPPAYEQEEIWTPAAHFTGPASGYRPPFAINFMHTASNGAAKLATLPVINLAPFLKPEDGKGRLSAAAKLHAACLEYGFFYLDISSYIDPSEPEELTRLAREFFALPQAEKDTIALKNEDHARGYARLRENVTNGKADNHEAIDLYRPVDNPDKTKPVWGTNQWPDIPAFKEKYDIWVEKMKKLGVIVMEAMALGLGMSPAEWGELRSKVDESFWVMRIIGYPPLPTDDEGFSCGAHKDYGCLTFLYADPTPGALQVWFRQPGYLVKSDANFPEAVGEDGVEEGTWINADPLPGCIVCNIGEMWEIWTNGVYKSTLHRVVHRSSNYRVSIPFFFEPNFDALIEPLPAASRLLDGTPDKGRMQVTRGKKYDPVVYGEFLTKKVGNNFDTGKNPLRSLVTSSAEAGSPAYGQSEKDQVEVADWIDKISAGEVVKPENLKDLESQLTSRTYIVNNYLTAADVALYGALHPVLSQLQPPQYYSHPAVTRYFDHIQNRPSVRKAAESLASAFSLVPFDLEGAPKLERKTDPPKEKKKPAPPAEGAAPKAASAKKEKKEAPAAQAQAETAKSEEAGTSGKAQKKEKKEKKPAANDGGNKKAAEPADAGEPVPSMIDLRVGKIIDVKVHPDADGLYIEQIDFGEETGPRTVVSGLVKYVPIENMRDKYLIGVCNLKPANMRGVKSFAMVLCATHKDGKDAGIELVQPPPGSQPGERIYFEGAEFENATPLAQLNPKKKIFETVQPGFITLDTHEAAWINPVTKSVHKIRTKDAVCLAPTFVGASLS
ncbi:hypothetical protein EUX98_g6201 [Antrodiella citrinella]|uniref:tRNA-binding domain-containing protein n=1 Tax=Antrodiella citrinella TaxID=2447956 RepID=A0A4S4MRR6_9APHY|nr:hypothetical protein EUX98_g6201 [Antrodiella citrinella]